MSFDAQEIANQIYKKLSHNTEKLNEILQYLGFDLSIYKNNEIKKTAKWLFLNYDMNQKQVNNKIKKAIKSLGNDAKFNQIKDYISLHLRESLYEAVMSDSKLRDLFSQISKAAFKSGAVKVAAKNELSQSKQNDTENRSNSNQHQNHAKVMNDEIYSLLKNMGVDQEDIDYLKKNIKRTGDVERWLKNHKSPELSATLAAVGAAYLRNK